MSAIWKKCSICKKDIPFGAAYYRCSVSTCKHPRTGLQFCSLPCWDGHLGFVNHRDSWAEEAVAPRGIEELADSKKESSMSETSRPPVRKIVEPISATQGLERAQSEKISHKETDTLVVVSKVKQLIRERSEFNTSQCCVDALTEKVAECCLQAIERARAAGRKTVMGRDVQ